MIMADVAVSLLEAAGEGDVSRLDKLISDLARTMSTHDESLTDRGPDEGLLRAVNFAAEGGITPLHSAAAAGQVDAIAFLLGRGARVRSLMEGGTTPLHCAAAGGFQAALRMMMRSADASLGIGSGRGGGEVAVAAAELLEMRNANGATALHCAVSSGDYRTVKTLLDAKANVNARTKDGWVPLHYAIASPNPNPNQSAIAQTDGQHSSDDSSSSSSEANDILGLLLSRGAFPDSKNDTGTTALHLAAGLGKADAIRILLNRDANLHVVDVEGNTPLHYATARGKVEAVRVLCDRGADLSVKNKKGQNALFVATQLRQFRVRNFLIDRMVYEESEEMKTRDVMMWGGGKSSKAMWRILGCIFFCCLLESD